MDKETEIKLRFKSKNSIVKKLLDLGQRKKKYSISEIGTIAGLEACPTRMIFWIREKGKEAELSFKGDLQQDNNIWTRTEITVGISDPESVHKILVSLDLQMIKENFSRRECWHLYGLEIMFIKFTKPAKLDLLEVEGDAENIKKLVKELGRLVVEIGEEAFENFDKKKSV